jgi:hypothetical protein
MIVSSHARVTVSNLGQLSLLSPGEVRGRRGFCRRIRPHCLASSDSRELLSWLGYVDAYGRGGQNRSLDSSSWIERLILFG